MWKTLLKKTSGKQKKRDSVVDLKRQRGGVMQVFVHRDETSLTVSKKEGTRRGEENSETEKRLRESLEKVRQISP